MAGTETVQLYIRRMGDDGGPIKALRGYQRVTLQPGETKTIEMVVDKKTLETWDATTNTMRFVPGDYEIMVGTSSRKEDLRKYELRIEN